MSPRVQNVAVLALLALVVIAPTVGGFLWDPVLGFFTLGGTSLVVVLVLANAEEE